MELSLKLISSKHALSFCVLYNKHCLINAEQMSNNMIRAVQLQDSCKQVPRHFYSSHYGLLSNFFLRFTFVPQLNSLHKEQPTISSRYFFFRDWCRSRSWLAISLYWSLSCWQVSSSLERISNASFLLSSFLLHTRYCRKEKTHTCNKAFLPKPVLDTRGSSSSLKSWRKTAQDQSLPQVILAY